MVFLLNTVTNVIHHTSLIIDCVIRLLQFACFKVYLHLSRCQNNT